MSHEDAHHDAHESHYGGAHHGDHGSHHDDHYETHNPESHGHAVYEQETYHVTHPELDHKFDHAHDIEPYHYHEHAVYEAVNRDHDHERGIGIHPDYYGEHHYEGHEGHEDSIVTAHHVRREATPYEHAHHDGGHGDDYHGDSHHAYHGDSRHDYYGGDGHHYYEPVHHEVAHHDSYYSETHNPESHQHDVYE